MAAVYAATHRNTKRVAVKILHPELSVDDNARERFLREGYAANQVGHRGAVAADDDGTTEDGITFLVMELLEGETIEARGIRLGGRLEARDVLALTDQALATLEAAHEKGIVHRDLKPENLFLTRDGVLKVLDFGIARVHDKFGKSPSQTQGVMGTPSFMAPEQARGRWEDVDPRTDLWAIGATMFTLLAGRVVHEAETANETLVLAVTQRAPALAQVVPEIHPAVAELVDKSLAYERELRFQTASEFRVALRAVHATIAGDESLPALAVPIAGPISVARPVQHGLTTEGGVAASVRFGQTTRIRSPRRSAKLPMLALALTGMGLLALAGRGLLGAHAKPAAIGVEAQTLAAGHALNDAQHPANSVPLASAVNAPAPPALIVAQAASAPVVAPSELAPQPVRQPIVSAARATAAARSPALLASAAKPRTTTTKSTSDLFKKRH